MTYAPEQDAAPTLTEPKDAAVQAGTQVTEAAAQAAGHTPQTVDVAVQAEVPRHLLQPPSLQQPAAQALHLAPPAVPDVFCPAREFWVASRAEQEHDRRDRDHQQKEDRRKDLEDLQKMLDKSSNLIFNTMIFCEPGKNKKMIFQTASQTEER